jgi:transcriptional regulator with XRE-family HTH domain
MTVSFDGVPKRLGAAVRVLRKEAGLSQMALAEKAGLTLNYIGNVERGEKVASVETLVRIARALEINGSELLAKADL